MADRGKGKGSVAKGGAVHVPFEVNWIIIYIIIVAFFALIHELYRAWCIPALNERKGRCTTIGLIGSYKKE